MRASRLLLLVRRDNLYILATALFPAIFFGSDPNGLVNLGRAMFSGPPLWILIQLEFSSSMNP
jgi:hypothetical protein